MLEIFFSILSSTLVWIGALIGFVGAYLAWNFLPANIDPASISAILLVGGVMAGCAAQYLVGRERSASRKSSEVKSK